MFIRIRASVKRLVRLWTNGMTQRSTGTKREAGKELLPGAALRRKIPARQNGKAVPVPGLAGQPKRLFVRKTGLRLPHIGSR